MKISHQFARIFHPEHLHAPKGITPVLGKQPLYFEIGAGKGKHALLFAEQNPDCTLIAVERTHEKFAAFDKQLKIANLANLQAIHADAIAFAVHFLPPKSLAGVFILYPNPEPHNKNQRFVNMPFFEFLLSRMQPNATITIASNIESYIDEAGQMLVETWRLPFVKKSIESSSARTHFEIKYLARGEHCQELVISKPADYCTRFDDFMPNAL